ncbi:YqhG family protein [Aquibacillus sp. 3ASR75-11]|uniref:YqhG family protein n=1 Tax=Terrihalobacillus insolitus TaxID=2950438 RepID=A0A9X4AM73_9BACI|nr:YqhG family protein [Terrihalobacillus insolitus]MDC3413408.1 YqhG family protein [Terrihalobacillus insolitus]MDC3424991.1 YqhG family protein [Terrihalobacillus insolitus]
MELENLHDFLVNYFVTNQCEIIENENGRMKVQLTDKMDEALMNRPFYWQYVKKLGYPGEPMQVTFITNPDRKDEEGEWVHFGSPRLHQIFKTLTTQGKYTKQFERVSTNQKTALVPWLVTNIKISYKGKQKKNEMLSVGLHLINGTMVTGMMDSLHSRSFQSSISDFCYTITPIIRLKSGYQRIVQQIEKWILQQEHTWAKESIERMEEEKVLLKHFYENGQELDEEEKESTKAIMEQELKDIEDRFKPEIALDVVNGGIFYLSQASSMKMIT